MTVITFDTLKFANRLKQAGVPSAHVEAEAEALADILDANLGEFATKADAMQAVTHHNLYDKPKIKNRIKFHIFYYLLSMS